MNPYYFLREFSGLFKSGNTIAVSISCEGEEGKMFTMSSELISPEVENASSFQRIRNSKLELEPLLQMRVFWDTKARCVKISSYMLEQSGEVKQVQFLKSEYEFFLTKIKEDFEKLKKEENNEIIENCYKDLKNTYSILRNLFEFLDSVITEGRWSMTNFVSPLTTWDDIYTFITILKQVLPDFMFWRVDSNFLLEKYLNAPAFNNLISGIGTDTSNIPILNLPIKHKNRFVVKFLIRLGVVPVFLWKKISKNGYVPSEPTFAFGSINFVPDDIDKLMKEFINELYRQSDFRLQNAFKNASSQPSWRCIIQLLDYLGARSILIPISEDSRSEAEIKPLTRESPFSNYHYKFCINNCLTEDSLSLYKGFCTRGDRVAEALIKTEGMDENLFSIVNDLKEKGVKLKLDIGKDPLSYIHIRPKCMEFLVMDGYKSKENDMKIKVDVTLHSKDIGDVYLPSIYWEWFLGLSAVKSGSIITFNSFSTKVNAGMIMRKAEGAGIQVGYLLFSEYIVHILRDTSNCLKSLYLGFNHTIEFTFAPQREVGNIRRELRVTSCDLSAEDLLSWVMLWRFKVIHINNRDKLVSDLKNIFDEKKIAYHCKDSAIFMSGNNDDTNKEVSDISIDQPSS